MNICKQNFQVKAGDPRVMELIYKNSGFFNAYVCLPTAEILTFRDFNLFRPQWTDYHERPNPGAYMSRSAYVEDFYEKGNQIHLIQNMPDTRNVLMLGLVYDFMSFAAEHLNVDVVSRRTIMAGRVIMRNDIKLMDADPRYTELHVLTKIFHAIVDSIRPPYIVPLILPPPEVRTFSVMSATVPAPQRYEDLSGIDTDDDMDLDDALDIFGHPDDWEDTSEASLSPTQALQEKDRQRADITPVLLQKRDRHLRNEANFPDTPELFTPQPKRLKKVEIRAAKAGVAYDNQEYDADTFPVQPPRTPLPNDEPNQPRRSNTTTPTSAPTPSTPQSTPRRVCIGRYANGAPRWGYKTKPTKTLSAAPDPSQSSSSKTSGSSRSMLTTTTSYQHVDSGSAAQPNVTYVRELPPSQQSGSSRTFEILRDQTVPTRSHSASAASQSSNSGSAAREETYQYWDDTPAELGPPSASSVSAASAHGSSASAAPLRAPDSASAASGELHGPHPERASRPQQPPVVDLTSPAPIRRTLPKLRKNMKKLNLLHAVGPSHRILSIAKNDHKIIIDSGASTSGTGLRGKLKNLRPATCTVNAAFGETITPSEMGDLPPYMLPTIVIEGMKNTTLLSVSQACAENMCGIFTSKDCIFFDIKEVQPYIAQISKNCEMKLRGEVEDGLYIQKSI
jgi:hypothetical protein